MLYLFENLKVRRRACCLCAKCYDVSVHAHQLLRLLYPAPRPAPGLTIVWRQSQVIPPLVVVGAGKSRKEQRPLASFFSPTTGPSPASHGPLRTPGSSARLQAKNAVTAVATQFFCATEAHLPVNESRPVGASSAERKARDQAVSILSTSFREWYLGENPEARWNVAEGTENKRILMNSVEVWWNSSSEAQELRLDNQ